MRVGESYQLINYGEKRDFKLIEIMSDNNYLVKDLVTLEEFLISDLYKYGKGTDFELNELYEK